MTCSSTNWGIYKHTYEFRPAEFLAFCKVKEIYLESWKNCRFISKLPFDDMNQTIKLFDQDFQMI